MAASRQTSLDTSRVQVRTPAAAHGGKTWSLSIERADEGVLEDGSIQLGKKLTNVLSLTVEDVFGIAD